MNENVKQKKKLNVVLHERDFWKPEASLFCFLLFLHSPRNPSPDAFMEVVEDGAIEINKGYNTDSLVNIFCKKVCNNTINRNTEYAI